MSAIKKLNTDLDNQINSRIQRKFDLVFAGTMGLGKKKEDSTQVGSLLGLSNDDKDIGEIEMTSSAYKKDLTEIPQIDLDFTIEDEIKADVPDLPQTQSPTTDGLDFSLDFNAMEEMGSGNFSSSVAGAGGKSEEIGIEKENFNTEFAEETKKTIVVDSSTFSSAVDLESFQIDPDGEGTTDPQTADLMSTEEAKANIESTIKDILRPKNLGHTQDIDLTQMKIDQAQERLDFTKTPSNNFSLNELALENTSASRASAQTDFAQSAATGEFFIDPSDFGTASQDKTTVDMAAFLSTPIQQGQTKEVLPVNRIDPAYEEQRTQRLSDEDSIRFHATIRQLREEREELVGQIKFLKAQQKELEQDNLSLKAGFDEAKIEISILRKRHMVELDDMKYRLTLSEEKKSIAEEKARQAELRRDKLEQKVRIDYNQVKLREKELESKLEMLSMDIDSQVQGRDQKILELRRKIDALEFNMENASIKEQRSHEDKRKLEDKLNKIMKTLRNSIKNLEEDIDLVQDDMPTTEKN